MRLSILTPAQLSAVACKRDGQTRAEIARTLGVTPQAIKKLWSRARKRLRSTMTPDELKLCEVSLASVPRHVMVEQLRGPN
jgi:DNA-binding CsgD family transcriptional regulator